MSCSVYMITAGRKRYVGVSSNVPKRMEAHLAGDFAVGRAMRKHPWSVEVLYQGSREDCFEQEVRLIEVFDTLAPKGLNLTPGGLGGPGRTPAVQQAIAATLKQRFEDPAAKAEMVERLNASRRTAAAKKKHAEAMKAAYANGWTEKRRAASVDGV